MPGHWLLQGRNYRRRRCHALAGTGIWRLGTEEAKADRGVSSLDLMNEEAKVIPAGSDGVVFLPYMSGERSPIWDPDAKGVYYGLDFSKKKGHLIRAAMEGTAYALKHNLEAAEEAGAKVEVLKAMGGAANSHLWTQIKSDVTGKTDGSPLIRYCNHTGSGTSCRSRSRNV